MGGTTGKPFCPPPAQQANARYQHQPCSSTLGAAIVHLAKGRQRTSSKEKIACTALLMIGSFAQAEPSSAASRSGAASASSNLQTRDGGIFQAITRRRQGLQGQGLQKADTQCPNVVKDRSVCPQPGPHPWEEPNETPQAVRSLASGRMQKCHAAFNLAFLGWRI